LAIVAAGCGAVHLIPAPERPAATALSLPAHSPSPGRLPVALTAPAIAIVITGTGPLLSITFDINNRTTQHFGPIDLPYTYKDTDIDDIDGAYPVTVTAVATSKSPNAAVRCRIVELGVAVANVTATGPQSIASCSDHQPQNPTRRQPHRKRQHRRS
jgi:hypothetical protein